MIKSAFFVTLFLLVLTVYSSAQDEFTQNPVEIAQFKFQNIYYRVLASPQNKDEKNLEEFQFRYDPAFLLKTKENGDLDITEFQTAKGFKVRLRIVLASNQITDMARDAIYHNVPRLKGKLNQASNVAPLIPYRICANIVGISDYPNSHIELGADSVDNPVPGNCTSVANTPTDLLLDIVTPNKAAADQIISELIPHSQILFRMDVTSQSVKRNALAIKYEVLKTSNLFATLNGLNPPSKEAYVHRDDLRRLSENIEREIQIDGTIEDPDKFKDDLIEKIISQFARPTDADVASFDGEKLKSTFHPDDLKPDKITEDLNKIFEKRDDTWQVKNAGSNSKDGKIGYDGFELGLDLKNSYSSDELQKHLSEHDITAEFKGEKIVVKSIKLQKVNLNAFDDKSEFVSRFAYLKDIKGTRSGTIDVENMLRNVEAIYPNIDTRVGVLEGLKTSIMPIGSVIAYAGNIDNLDVDTEGKWMVCNGKILDKNRYSDLYKAIGLSWGGIGDNFSLPDLRGQFLRGVDDGTNTDSNAAQRTDKTGRVVGSIIGSYQSDTTKLPTTPFVTDDSGDHNHNNGNFNILLTTDNRATTAGCCLDDDSGGYQPDLAHYPNGVGNIKPAGSHTHKIVSGGDDETRPKNAAVYWLIRVR